MSEKQYSTNPILNDIFADTARNMDGVKEGYAVENSDGHPVVKRLAVEGEAVERWKEIAFSSTVAPEPPPFSVPISDVSRTVEVAPGILVSEHLIRDAVEATSAPGVAEQVEARENAKKKMFEELRQDINTSKQVVQSIIDRLRNPPNLQEKFISYDAMPPLLQRVVNAYIAASDANRELDEAIKALAAEPRSTT